MRDDTKDLLAFLGGILLVILIPLLIAMSFDMYKTNKLIEAAERGKVTLNLNLNGGK